MRTAGKLITLLSAGNPVPPDIWTPTLLIQDSFTDADATLLTSHTPNVNTPGHAYAAAYSGSLKIVSNKAFAPATDNRADTIDAGTGDVTISADFFYKSNSNGSIFARFSATNAYWRIQQLGGSGAWAIAEVNPSYAIRNQLIAAAVDGTTYHMVAVLNGNTLSLYVDKLGVCRYASANLKTNTKHGIYLNLLTDSFDNFQITAPVRQIIFEGDSLTAGSGSTGGLTFPQQVMNALTYSWAGFNIGVGGSRLADLNTRVAASVTAFATTSPVGTIVVWAGTNDLYDGTSAADTFATYKSYCQARQAEGYKVIAVTITPRSNAGTPAGFEAQRQLFNASVRADNSFYDKLADVGYDGRIGQAGQELDTTYYDADKVHMNNTGYAIVAGYVKNAILRLIF